MQKRIKIFYMGKGLAIANTYSSWSSLLKPVWNHKCQRAWHFKIWRFCTVTVNHESCENAGKLTLMAGSKQGRKNHGTWNSVTISFNSFVPNNPNQECKLSTFNSMQMTHWQALLYPLFFIFEAGCRDSLCRISIAEYKNPTQPRRSYPIGEV